MNLLTKLIIGFLIGIAVGGIVGFYGALVHLPVALTAGIIGPITAAIVAVVLLKS
jgi:hypothetical protein